MIVTTTNRTQAPAGTVLHIVGDVDAYAADDLRDHLRGLTLEPDETLVVDLSAVTYMSCTALGVLAEAQARLGSRLILGRRSEIVSRLLDITALTSLFPVATGKSAEPPSDERQGGTDGGSLRPRETEARTWTISRSDVHRARGVLMAVHGCDADQAWSMLALAAARHGAPVGELVELLIRKSGSAPSSAAAAAALTVLMRKPLDDPQDDGDPGATAGRDRPAEQLTNI